MRFKMNEKKIIKLRQKICRLKRTKHRWCDRINHKIKSCEEEIMLLEVE